LGFVGEVVAGHVYLANKFAATTTKSAFADYNSARVGGLRSRRCGFQPPEPVS